MIGHFAIVLPQRIFYDSEGKEEELRVSFAKQEAGVIYLSYSYGWTVYQMVALVSGGFKSPLFSNCLVELKTSSYQPIIPFFDVFLPSLLLKN